MCAVMLWPYLVAQRDSLSRSVKRIRVKVAVKSAVKCLHPDECRGERESVRSAKLTLKRTLRRPLKRVTYSDTLNRSTSILSLPRSEYGCTSRIELPDYAHP